MGGGYNHNPAVPTSILRKSRSLAQAITDDFISGIMNKDLEAMSSGKDSKRFKRRSKSFHIRPTTAHV